MAFHKKDEFSLKEQSLANFAKALSHPARIAILSVLAKRTNAFVVKLLMCFRLHKAP